jgi:hypothetical protein
MNKTTILVCIAAFVGAIGKDVQSWKASGQPWDWSQHLAAWALALTAALTAAGIGTQIAS